MLRNLHSPRFEEDNGQRHIWSHMNQKMQVKMITFSGHTKLLNHNRSDMKQTATTIKSNQANYVNNSNWQSHHTSTKVTCQIFIYKHLCIQQKRNDASV